MRLRLPLACSRRVRWRWSVSRGWRMVMVVVVMLMVSQLCRHSRLLLCSLMRMICWSSRAVRKVMEGRRRRRCHDAVVHIAEAKQSECLEQLDMFIRLLVGWKCSNQCRTLSKWRGRLHVRCIECTLMLSSDMKSLINAVVCVELTATSATTCVRR